MFLPSWGPILFRIIIMVCNTRRETFGHLRKVLFVISLHSLRRLTPKRHFRFYIIFLFWASLLFPVFSSLSTMFSKACTSGLLKLVFVWRNGLSGRRLIMPYSHLCRPIAVIRVLAGPSCLRLFCVHVCFSGVYFCLCSCLCAYL